MASEVTEPASRPTYPCTLICNSLTHVEESLNTYEDKTVSKFILHNQSKKYGKSEEDCGEIVRMLPQHKSSRLTYQTNIIPFSGQPFLTVADVTYYCHQGIDKNISKKKKEKLAKEQQDLDDHCILKRNLSVQSTKKTGCPIKVHVQQIIRFPSFVAEDSEYSKKATKKKLVNAIAEANTEFRVEYHMLLPDPALHQFHLKGSDAGVSEPIDPRISSRIHELVSEGVRDVREMKRHLNTYLTSVLFPHGPLPSKRRRRYFPHDHDIANHISQARMKQRYQNMDQDNVEALVKEWNEDPEHNLYFRKSTATSANALDVCDTKLLFIHQTQQQQRLLKRYGEFCFMDATYKTTRYALPLFFLCVRANTSYQVVCSFIIQDEQTTSIQEALHVIKLWNPEWNPVYWIVDFCQEEISALEHEFPQSQVFICDFHREQAWERYVKGNAQKDEILAILRRLQRADNFDSVWREIQETSTWKMFDAGIRAWFENTWLPQKQRWAQSYRSKYLHFALTTNNGIERQNEHFKYRYLSGRGSRLSMSEMLKILITEYIPDSFKKYTNQNLMASSLYRQYAADIPQFLHSKPRYFINHILRTRWHTALSMNDIHQDGYGHFRVDSERGRLQYQIFFGSDEHKKLPYCGCDDWKTYQLPCKHFCAIFKHVPGWSFNQLPHTYRNHPLLTLDDDVFGHHQLAPNVTSTAPTSINEDESSHTPFVDTEMSVDQDSSTPLTQELPPRRRSSRKHKAEVCRSLCKEIIGLTYLNVPEEVFTLVQEGLQNCLTTLTGRVQKEDNVPLRKSPSKVWQRKQKSNAAKRIQKKYSKFKLDFPVKEMKGKHQYTGRVGKRASMMRKQFKVSKIPTIREVTSSAAWVKIGDITLQQSDQDVLLCDGELNDNHINAAQTLVRNAQPSLDGLRDTLLFSPRFALEPARGDAVQIHHVSAQHWVLSVGSLNKKTVQVYDSSSASLSVSLRQQLVRLYKLYANDESLIDVIVLCVQRQNGVKDCGLFAIANMFAIALGVDLSTISFDQREMRQHLHDCFVTGRMTMFPNSVIESCNQTSLIISNLSIHCICNTYLPNENVLKCKACSKVFHVHCITHTAGSDDIASIINESWLCDLCKLPENIRS